jgi:hypothetical protein
MIKDLINNYIEIIIWLHNWLLIISKKINFIHFLQFFYLFFVTCSKDCLIN